MYTEFEPTEPILGPLVECFWVNQSTGNPNEIQRVVPDGCVDVIYRFAALAGTAGNRVHYKSLQPTLVGTMTQSIITPIHALYDYLGIRFRPGGIAAFIQVPLWTLTNTIRPVDTLYEPLGTPIQKRLEKAGSWPNRFQVLETCLMDLLLQTNYPLTAIMPVIRQLLHYKEHIPTAHLGQVATLSSRQVERLFRQYVGVSPKMLVRIIRFRHVRTILDTRTNDSLMGVAFDNGYTDHAHLTKEFKAFAGITPSAYLMN